LGGSTSRNVDVNHVVRKNCAAIKLLGGHEDKVKTKVKQFNTGLKKKKRHTKEGQNPASIEEKRKREKQKLQGMTDEQGGEK